MLCAVIYQVFSAGGSVEFEFPSNHAAAEPVEYHVHGLGVFGDNGVVGDSHGGGIISLDQ